MLVSVAGLFGVVGCGPTTAPTPEVLPAGTSAAEVPVEESEQAPAPEVVAPYPGWAEITPSKGIGHRTAISKIHADRGGTVALTEDNQRVSMLWSRLDGSVEPTRTPFSSIKDADVAKIGDAIVVGVIDTATRLNIATTDANGDLKIRYSGRPADRMNDVAILPQGGRIIALRTTGAIEILGQDGALRASFDERGFKPTRLHVTGKNTFVSIAASAETGSVRATFEHFIVKEHQPQQVGGETKTAIERLGQPIELDFSNVISFRAAAISPNGRLTAVLLKGSGANATIDRRSIAPSIGSSSPSDSSASEAIATGDIPNSRFIDFSDNETIIVRTRHNGVWKVDAKSGSSHLVAMKTHSERRPAHPIAGKYISSVGGWLHVLDLSTQSGLYMGYRGFVPTSAAVSPSANLLVATTSLDLYLHDRKRKTSFRREFTRGYTLSSVSFLDEQHLIVVTRRGSATIVRLDDQTVVAAIDGPGYISYSTYYPGDGSAGNLESGGGMLAFGGSQGTWVTAVTKDGFSPSAVIRDGSNAGGFFQSSTGLTLWTTSYTILRTFGLAELREGVSNTSATKRGVRIQGPRPIGLTHAGGVLGLSGPSNSQLTIFKPPTLEQSGASSAETNGSSTKYFQLDVKNPIGSVTAPRVSRVFSSPVGDFMLVTSNNSVFGVDGSTLKPTWEKRTANGAAKVSFSSNGEHAALVSGSSAAIIESKTGEFVHRMCSPQFVVTKLEPVNLVMSHGIGLCD